MELFPKSNILDFTNNSYPILDVGNRQGMTDYIDFIRETEVTSPVMRGIDRFKRPFIVMKVVCTFKGDYSNRNPMDCIQTFFQRYTDDLLRWNSGYAGGVEFLNTSGDVRRKEFDMLDRLIMGETVDIPERFIGIYQGYNDKRIEGTMRLSNSRVRELEAYIEFTNIENMVLSNKINMLEATL